MQTTALSQIEVENFTPEERPSVTVLVLYESPIIRVGLE
jgi:hypothetical protein